MERACPGGATEPAVALHGSKFSSMLYHEAVPPRTLRELIDVNDPAWPKLQELLAAATNQIEVLPPPELPQREAAVAGTGVSLWSMLGAVVYHTGGLLIDRGWVRVLGAGHPRLPRTVPKWNAGRGDGFTLVADDVVGGFFALDGGKFASSDGKAHYFAPDCLRWEPLGFGYSGLIEWLCTGRVAQFYENLRWAGWQQETARLTGDEAFTLYPPPWSIEGKDLARVSRRPAPIAEVFSMNVIELPRQLGK